MSGTHVSFSGISSETWNSGEKPELLLEFILEKHPHIESLSPGFISRFKKWIPVFLEHYGELYGLKSDTLNHVTDLMGLVTEGLAERPGRLLKKDREREESDWYQHPSLIGGMLYIDKFAGNFKGVADKISYLQELGINYLHLMPFYKTIGGFNDGGYAVSDYRKTQSALGTIEDLKELAAILDENSIELVADVVMNHTSDRHEWAKKALSGNQKYQDFYLMFDDREEVNQYEKYLIDVFPEFAPGSFTFNEKLNKWIWTSFYNFQWDLNYKNPEVFNAMFGEIQFIANLGASVLRMDAVPFIWKEKGNSSQNLPQAHAILRAYRALMRITSPSVVLKSEAIVSPQEIIKYLGTGGYEGFECDLGYNATLMNHMWHALACQNTHLLRTTLSNLPEAPKTATWINYVRCHDDIGWGISEENAAAVGQSGPETRRFCTEFYNGELPGSYAEGYVFQKDPGSGEARISGTGAALAGLQKAQVEADPAKIDLALKRLLLLYSITYFYKGMPLLYIGEEIGQFNDFSYLNNPHRREDNRWIHRPDMDWNKADLRKKQGTPEQRLFHGLKTLARVRKQQRALHSAAGCKIRIIDHDAVFAVERVLKDAQLWMVSNFSDKPIHLPAHILPGHWQHANVLDVFDDKTKIRLSGLRLNEYEFKWYQPVL